jgi:hypothetical protein
MTQKDRKQQSVRVPKETLDLIRPVAWIRKTTMLETLDQVIREWIALKEAWRQDMQPEAMSLKDMQDLYHQASDKKDWSLYAKERLSDKSSDVPLK